MITVSDKGLIYSAWTEESNVKVTSKYGSKLEPYNIDLKNMPLNIDQLGIPKSQKDLYKEYTIPETWPIISNIVVDEKERLWVSTISNTDSLLHWFIFNERRETIVNFKFKGSRLNNSIVSTPVTLVKNGYFYEHEFDFNQGIDRITKYKINLKNKNEELVE